MQVLNKRADYAVSIALLALGTFLMAVSFSIFLLPINVVAGGFGGFAALVVRLLSGAGIDFIPVGMLTLAMNIPLYLFSVRIIGRRFAVLSFAGVVFYSLFIDVAALIYAIPEVSVYMQELHQSPLLSAIYGGVIAGIGVGTVIRVGGSTGGSDMLAVLIASKRPSASIGAVLLMVDAFVIVMSAFVYESIISALHALLAIFISTMILDYVVEGTRAAKAYYIISDKSDEIAQQILTRIGRGVTSLKGKGMFTSSEKNVLLCLVTRTQIAELRRITHTTDPKAFMFSTSVKEVIGEGFGARTYHGENKNRPDENQNKTNSAK